MEFDHAKLVEIPLEHQMPHYNIFTEASAIPRKDLVSFTVYNFSVKLFSEIFVMHLVSVLGLSILL